MILPRLVYAIDPHSLTAVGDILYFIVYRDGPELWKSDGTEVGTVRVYKWDGGPNPKRPPDGLIALGNTLILSADDGIHGKELWKSDGTPLGTMMIADIWSGEEYGWQGSRPFPLKIANNTLFFGVNASINGKIFWRTDGTSAGTAPTTNDDTLYTIGTRWAGSTAALRSVILNGEAFFADGTLDEGGSELWKYSSFTKALSPVADIWPGSNSSDPSELVAVGSTLFFTADDGIHGRELWKSNGTPEGTRLVADLMPGSAGSRPTKLTLFKDNLYFFATHPTLGLDTLLWKSDGTAAGTIPVASTVLRNLYLPWGVKVVGNNLVFFNGEHEIWKTDGTDTGTVMIADLHEIGYRLNGIWGPFGDFDYTSIGNTIFLSLTSTLGPSLYAFNTTENSTTTVRLSLNQVSVSEDGTSNLIYTFSRTGPTSSSLSVKYTVGGTATLGKDYTGIAATPAIRTITFAANASTARLAVNPTADTSQEGNETVTVQLTSGAGYTIGTTAAVTGTILNDDIIGTAANDNLIGTPLDEYLFGGGGNDTLQGNGGQDRLDGGSGSDILTGGPDADTFLFRFSQSRLATPDRLTDFAIGSDKLDLLSATGAALPSPRSFSRASDNTATSLASLVSVVFTDANGATAGNQPLAASSAALVVATSPAIAGTWLVINDARPGFQTSNDLLVNLSGFTGTLPAPGSIAVGTWFV